MSRDSDLIKKSYAVEKSLYYSVVADMLGAAVERSDAAFTKEDLDRALGDKEACTELANIKASDGKAGYDKDTQLKRASFIHIVNEADRIRRDVGIAMQSRKNFLLAHLTIAVIRHGTLEQKYNRS